MHMGSSYDATCVFLLCDLWGVRMYVTRDSKQVKLVVVQNEVYVEGKGAREDLDPKEAASLLTQKLGEIKDNLARELSSAKSGFEVEHILVDYHKTVSEINKLLRLLAITDSLNALDPAKVAAGEVSSVLVMDSPEPVKTTKKQFRDSVKETKSEKKPKKSVEIQPVVRKRRKLARGRRRVIISDDLVLPRLA